MTNIKTTILLFLIFASALLAQTPSEIRKQKMKEKESEQQIKGKNDNLTPSQKRVQKSQDENGKSILGDDDIDFKKNDVPEKWKNESAVILCQKTTYSFTFGKVSTATNMGAMMGKAYISKEIVRKKIKMLDKGSIEAFSEFYVPIRNTESSFGIRIIKPNGSIIDVDTKQAIEIEKTGGKKIALPDLQIGDILDYFTIIKQWDLHIPTLQQYKFTPYIFTLNAEYPIIVQKFEFQIGEEMFFNFNSYNGAPNLMQVPIDKSEASKAKFRLYSLEDRNRDKKSKDIWNYEYITSPTIKFQAIYAASNMAEESKTEVKEATCFINKIEEVKSVVTEKEIQGVLSRYLDQKHVNGVSQYNYYIGKQRRVMNFIKQSNEKDPGKILLLAYYFMRYEVAAMAYQYDQYEFTSIFLNVCEEYNIKAEVFAVAKKKYGALKDVLLVPELSIGVVVPLNEKEIFFSTPDDFSTPHVINSEIQGAEGIVFTPTFLKAELKNKKHTIPASSYSDNAIAYSSDVALDEQFGNIKVKRKTIMSGLCKTDYQPLALFGTPYVLNDKKRFEGDNEPSGNKGRITEARRKEDEKNKELLIKRMDKMKDGLKYDFDVVSYDTFEVLSDGRYDETPNLAFNEAFTIKNLINKAGKNYVFDIGKLIGKQLELDASEKKRDNDIYISYAKSFTNEIIINVPAGYTVEGLNDLNMNVTSESAAFTSIAKLEGGKIIIKTTKAYKKYYDSKANWPKLLEALEAAYKFTQKKVIFKKA